MGTTLTGTQINNTYDGLIKTGDNDAIGATAKVLSDGLGNDSCIAVSTSGTVFTGTADFTGATVSGITDNNTTYDLASAQAGSNATVTLTGSDASSDVITLAAGTNITLTDNGSNQITIAASGGGTDTTYDLGSAQSGSDVDVTLTGSDATTDTIKFVAGTNITLTDNGSCQVTITAAGGGGGGGGLVAGTGTDSMISCITSVPAVASGTDALAIGKGAQANSVNGIAIGDGAYANNSRAVAIGVDMRPGAEAVQIGRGASFITIAQDAIAIGEYAGFSSGTRSVQIGRNATAQALCAVSLGDDARIETSAADNAVALGPNTRVTASQAVAIGKSVTANRACHVTGCAFESKLVGKGLVVTSPDGLCTLGIGIDNTGAIVTYTP